MANTAKEKTSPKLAVCYAFGEVGCQMSWYMINSYLTLFYTDVVGLTATSISAIMLIARVWDAINDPMMGNIADHTKTKWGRFRPYLMFAPIVLAIFNILTFTVLPVTGMLKVVLCLLFYIGTGMAYTVCSIAYQALQNVIAIDSQVRMNLATARGIGSSVIGIILSACVMPMILAFGNSDVATAKGYLGTTIVLSVLMIPCFWITAAGCKETYIDVLHADKPAEKASFVKNLKELVANDQLLMVVLTTIGGTICVSGRMGILTYYVIYVVGSYTAIAYIFTVMTVAQLVGNFLVPWGTKTFGKKNYLIILQVIMVVGFILLFINPTSNMIYLMGVSFMCGLCNSSSSICYGMVADSLEYGDWKLGKRQEGMAASMLSFGVKIATAICGSGGVMLLAAVGYVAGAEQTAATQMGINAVVNLVPAAIGIIALIPLFFYKLTPQRVSEIRADLDAGKHKWDTEK